MEWLSRSSSDHQFAAAFDSPQNIVRILFQSIYYPENRIVFSLKNFDLCLQLKAN